MFDDSGDVARADEIATFETRMRRLHQQPGVGSVGLGVPAWDARLWQLGREWLEASPPSSDGTASYGPDVYLATQVYEVGGHTALIGDCVRALATPAHLVLTALTPEAPACVSPVVLDRLALPASCVTMLPGPSVLDRVRQLFAELRRLRPRRLFLVQHPHDPLPSVVAQPEIAPIRLLIHHADAVPSFALHLPGTRIVDLHATAAAVTRALGHASAHLPLTAPDPGPRPRGFLARGRLVTASCGSPHKYATPYPISYAAAIAAILDITQGWHVHIGPLYDDTRTALADTLAARGLPADRLVHVPWTPSLAATLWQHDCDVYVASFPINGARTRVDVMSAGIPYVAHTTRPISAPVNDDGDGGLRWHTLDELATLLRRLSNAAVLGDYGTMIRRSYEQVHHPRVFAATLRSVLDGGDGHRDVRDNDAARRATALLARALSRVAQDTT